METRACEEMNEGHLPFFGAPFDSPFNNLSRNPISLIGGRLEKRNFKLDHGHHAIEPNSPTHLESNKRSCLALECVNHKNDAGLAGFLSHAEKNSGTVRTTSSDCQALCVRGGLQNENEASIPVLFNQWVLLHP